MNEAEISKGIKHAWSLLSGLGIFEIFSDPWPITPHADFRKICLNSAATYEEVYLCGLKFGQYNFLLTDYSYFQFGGKDLDSLRFAYYPNPFLGASTTAVKDLSDLREFVDEGIISFDDYLQQISELRYSQHPPLVRYEHSEEQYKKLIHPCSHVHFGHHAENRWPVRRLLSPESFSLLIAKLFYSEQWQAAPSIRVASDLLSMDDLLIQQRAACALVSGDFFSDEEGKQFHIS